MVSSFKKIQARKVLSKYALLILLIVTFLTKSLIFILIFPPFQTPDEQAHFGYIQLLAERNHLIDPKNDWKLSDETIGILNLLNFKSMIYNQKIKIKDDKKSCNVIKEKINNLNTTQNRKNFALSGMSASTSPPLYYLMGAAVYKIFFSSNFFMRFYAIRFLSIVISFFTLIFVFLSSKYLFNSKKASYLFTLCIALHPMFSMLSISINPDNLVMLFFSVIFYLLLKSIRNKNLNLRDNIFIAIIISLTFLTKIYGLLFLLIYFIALPFIYNESLRKNMRVIIARLCLTIIVVGLIALPWYLSNTISPPNKLVSYSLAGYAGIILSMWKIILGGYWANFGWLDTPVFPVLLPIFTLILAGLVIFYFVPKFKDLSIKGAQINIERFTFIISVLLVSFIMGIDYLMYTKGMYFAQGRYFLITLPANTYLIIQSFKLINKKLKDVAILFRCLMIIFLLNIISIFFYIIPRYNHINLYRLGSIYCGRGAMIFFLGLLYISSFLFLYQTFKKTFDRKFTQD